MKISTKNPLAVQDLKDVPNVRTELFDVQDWIPVTDHSIQRDTDLRLKTMENAFKLGLPTLYTDFAAIEVTKSFKVKLNGVAVNVEKGLYKANGHTRSLFWQKNPTHIPEHGIIVNIYENVEDFATFEAIYNCYDSKLSVDNANNKIQGALRILGMKDKITSNVVRKGSFGSALSIAYPGHPKDDVIEKVSYFREEIIFLDKLGVFNTNAVQLRFQTLYASYLMFAKMFLTKDTESDNYIKLFDACRRISSIEKEDFISSDKKWDGITGMLYEIFNECEKGWIPEGMLRKTSYATVSPQCSFFLYCLVELWMNDKRLDRTKGFKHSAWLQYKEDSDSEPTTYYNYVRSNI